jgi:hypothetical protein
MKKQIFTRQTPSRLARSGGPYFKCQTCRIRPGRQVEAGPSAAAPCPAIWPRVGVWPCHGSIDLADLAGRSSEKEAK